MKVTRLLTVVFLVAVAMLLLPGCSCRTWNNLWNNGQAEPAEAFFWDKECKVVAPPAVKAPAKKAVKPAAKPAVKQVASDSSTVILPCAGCGVLKVSKSMPAEVQLNKTFDYFITVTNLTNGPVEAVKVYEHLASNFKFVSAEPMAKVNGKALIWRLGRLNAKESKKIKVSGIATSSATIKHCTNASYKTPACAATKVVEPKLALTRTVTPEIVICDKIAIKYTVRNTGTGNTTGVVIKETLPVGLTKVNGGNKVSIPVGTLLPGQAKSFTVMAVAEKTGQFASKAVATADGNMQAVSAVGATVVKQPVLVIKKTGRSRIYVGRNATYNINVGNVGDTTAKAVVLEDTIPAGTTFVSATMGGKVVGNKVKWNLGDLSPKASKSVSVTFAPSGIGKITDKAVAVADCAKAVSATATTEVKGIAAVLLEVIDLSDPIEVGGNETYKIVVVNQGSATATNVTIAATLEDSMKFVSATGATTGSVSGAEVKFAPLAKLAPKAKATWNLTVKAEKAGDVRMKVIMNCDQISRNVVETESTHFYK